MPGDLFHLPDNADHQQTFEPNGSWQTWLKPLGISMVHLFALSSGAGGGGGYSAGVNSEAGGGSSGCGGPMASLLIPAAFLPDVLSIYVPTGGAGGTAGNVGGVGAPGYIIAGSSGVLPAANLPAQTILPSGYVAAFGSTNGLAGTATTGGAVPSVASAATQANNCYLAAAGIFSAVAGAVGVAGQATFAPGSTALTSIVTGGGAGGGTNGTTNYVGGSIGSAAATATMPWLPVALTGGSTGGGNGQNGLAFRAPMYFTGGTGGGGNFSGQAGNGGTGAYGCGGGGGGGGATGGAGGAGGGGLVIVTAWLQRVTSRFPRRRT